MTNTLQERVSLPQGRRSRGGLLERALPLPSGWEGGGITFRQVGCTEPSVFAVCEVTDRTGLRPGDPPVFEPVWVSASAACSLLSQIGSTDISLDRLEATTEWGLGRALATGLGSDNPSFADATVIHADSGDDVTASMSCLEQAAADLGFGAEVVIHSSPRGMSYLAANHLTEWIDGYCYSPSGHPIIVSPGYPISVDSSDDTTVTLWATGSVFAGATPAYTLNGSNGRPPAGWKMNLDEAWAQRLGLAAFDPCLNLAATFVVPACIGG